MKHLLTLVCAVFLFSGSAWAQCTPNAPTGSPGLTPVTDSLACIEIGELYAEVVYLENFDDFSVSVPIIGQVTVTVDSLRIDDIENVPCGLNWEANKPSRTYYAGETGCIAINGRSYENVGQYLLDIFVTVWVTAPAPIGTQVFSGEASDVVNQVETLTGQSLGVDFEYYLRVIAPSDPCPNIIRNDTTVNSTASASCGPPIFTATVTGDTEVCPGETTALTVTFTNGVPPYDILWTGGGTDTTLTVGAGTFEVVALDSNTDTARATITVTELPLPSAAFTAVNPVGSGAVTITNNSTNAATYEWDFDGTAYTGATPSHEFTVNGDYDITLIATNDCGSDTITETVTISGIVGINELGNTLSRVQVVPNPSNGHFNLNLVAKQSSPVGVRIFNLQGQQVFAANYQVSAGQASTQSIQLTNSVAGLYIIQVQAGDALMTQKLIIE